MISNPTVLLLTKCSIEIPHSILTYATIMPELESRDVNPIIPIYVDTPNDSYVFNETEKVVHNLNGTYIKAIIISRTCDNDTSTPFYRIQFESDHFATCTTEFLSALTDTDITRPPITLVKVKLMPNTL